jgi:hypothetical protein
MANPRQEDCVKKRLGLQLSDEQQLIVGVLLVILLAISILYCLGFASIAVRQAWDNAPLPWNDSLPPEDMTDTPGTEIVEPTDAGAAPH